MPDHPRVPVRVALPIVLAAGALLWWWWSGEDVAPPVHHVVRADEVAKPGVGRAQRSEIERDVQTEPLVDAGDYGDEPEDADLEHPYPFELKVHLRGPLGLPVDDARVFLAPEEAGFSAWPVASQAGKVAVAWHGRQRTMRVQVAVTAWGVLQPIRSIVVESGRESHIAFSVNGRNDVLQSLRNKVERGERLSRADWKLVAQLQKMRRKRMDNLDIECGRTMVEFKLHRCTECHERSMIAPYQAIGRSGTMEAGLHEKSCFEDLRRSRMHGAAGEKRLAELEAERKQRKADYRERSAKYRATLSGRVRLPDGSGKAGMTVAWVGENGTVLETTQTDPAGNYRLEPISGGHQRIVVAAGPLGHADQVRRIAGRGNTVADFTLTTNQFVTGKVLDEGGDALSDWRVELVRDAAGFATTTATDVNGAFAAYGVPGPVECLIWPRGKNQPFPVLYGVEALVDASPVQFALREEQPIRGRLRVRAALPDGHDKARIDARVIQLDTGRVAQMKAFGFANEFVLEPLPAGRYRVQLGSPGLAWATRDINVDGRGLWDAGGVFLAPPGRVRIVQLPGAPDLMQYPHAFYRRTEAVDVRVDYEADGDVLLLAPGRHVLVWQANGDLRAREFDVASGVEVTIPIWPE